MADLGECGGGLFYGKKEENTEGRKVGRARKTKPLLALDPPLLRSTFYCPYTRYIAEKEKEEYSRKTFRIYS